MRAGRSISDSIDLLLYDKGFTPDTVEDDDILVYDDGTGLWTLQTITKDVTELTLYDKVFDSDTPADRDFVVYEEDTDSWHLERNLLSPISGIAFLTEGYDLEVDGDIGLPTGAEVGGVVMDEVLTTSGGGLSGEPLVNSMLYWKIPPASPGFWDHGHSGLLNGMNTPLHYHNTDRDRDNHTGTQAASTISDFEDTVGDMFDSSGNEHEMVDVEYGSDEKVNLSVNVPRLYGVIPSDTATNSTTWVDIPLNSITKSALTHTNGNANVEFDEPGDYMIAYAVVSDFNVNNQLAYGRIELDTGGGYALLAQSARQTHTSTALGTLVSSTVGPYSFSAGDEIKLTAAFSSGDAGSNFLRNKCSLSIWRIS